MAELNSELLLNAHVNARLIDLLNILDARAVVSIYKLDEKDNQVLLQSCVPVYQLLANFVDGTRDFRRYEVVGLIAGLTTNILIKKGE